MDQDAGVPNVDALPAATALFTKVEAYDQEIDELEDVLNNLKEKRRLIIEQELPDLMFDANLTSFTTADGWEVKAEQITVGGIPKENEAKALAWLRKNGHGGIIKSQINMAFGKGEDKIKERVEKGLVKLGHEFQTKEGVHPGTFRAWLREQREKGKKLPTTYFNVFDKRQVKYKFKGDK